MSVDEVVLVERGTIPKTSSGKRQRSRCREQYLEGRLHPGGGGKLRLVRVLLRSLAGHARLWGRGLRRGSERERER
ncbi:MAG: hypothetical protein U5R14_00585 [Gemmatimonadota bacterium]|nr:hypothetical protein [Gemmatimonadota bacterium]